RPGRADGRRAGYRRGRGWSAALAGATHGPQPAAGGRGSARRPRLPPTSRPGQQRGSAMGAHYRHTTPEMAARIATAIEQRLTMVLEAAEQVLEAHPN